MGKDDAPIRGQTDIDRLADAARRILGGESAEAVSRDLGCPLTDVRALADQLVAAGLSRPGNEATRVQWAPWLPRLLHSLFARRHPEPAEPIDSEPWGAWQPLPSARQLEVRTRAVRNAPAGSAGPLWAYEFRSQSSFTVSFRYRIDTETSGGFPRRVRGLRPGECYGGMTVVASPEPPGIDAELIEPDPASPASPTAAGP